MSTERINYLVRNYAANSATGEEVEELFEWLRQHSEDGGLQMELEKMAATTSPNQNYDPAYWETFITKVLEKREKIGQTAVHRIYMLRRSWFRFAAAAAVLAIITTIAVVILTNRKNNPSLANNNKQSTDEIAPGRERASLTLANGKVIMLDSATGNIVKQGDFMVVNLNGKLDYEGKDNAAQFHTLSTPKGGQYKLQLPDGTEVWLNAASSITYPTTFTGADRKVTVSGEAYFEVAKDKRKPFKVNVDNKSEVEVLGTHFNINSYADDGSIKTTLLEGSVKVSQAVVVSSDQRPGANNIITSVGRSVTLRPGQQGVQSINAAGISVKADADLDQVMAWKNGLFNFEQAGLKTVMAQLGRWYNIDIKYEGAVPSRTFRGKITRDLNLSQVIKVLEDVEVKFRIEGRTLIVMD